MPAITLKIPKRLDRVQIIRAEDFVIDEEPIVEEEPIEELDFSDLVVEEEQEPEPTVFTQEFVISMKHQPVQVVIPEAQPESMLLEEAKREVQAAYDKGFADGQDVTRTTYEIEIEQYRDWMLRIDSMAEGLRSQYFADLKNVEHSVLELGIMIAEQILCYEIDRNSNIFIEQLRKALKAAGEDTVFAIRLHPENVSIFEKIGSKLFGDITDISSVKLIKDSSLDKLGCVLITSTGLIDSTLGTQIDQVRRSLSTITDQSTLEQPEFVEELSKNSDLE